MIVKKNSMYFITLALWLFLGTGCITEDEAPVNSGSSLAAEPVIAEPEPPIIIEKPSDENNEDADPYAIASPITPQIAKSHPHLNGLEGDIVIGNANFHAVLAGVPLSRTATRSFKGIHAIYYLDKERGWSEFKIWNQLEFLRYNSQKITYTPIGINFENLKDGHSYATLIFAPAGKKSPQMSLTFHVFKNRNWIVIENNVGTKKSKPNENYWTARWRSSFGEQIIKQGEATASPYMIRFFDDELIGYIGPTQANTQVSLLPDTSFQIFDNNHASSNVSHFFIGSEEVVNMPHAAKQHRKCLESFKVSGGKYAIYKEINVKAYIKCFQDSPVPEDTITVSNEQDHRARYFVLNEKSQKINYIHVRQNSERYIPKQTQVTFQLEDAISSRRTPPSSSTESVTVRALTHKTSTARIFKPGQTKWEGPYLIRLLSHLAPNALTIDPQWDLTNIGTNLWQSQKWPINLTLPIGFYRVQAFHLLSGKTCTATIEVREETVSETVCQAKASDPSTSFATNVDIAQQLHPFYTYVTKDSAVRPMEGIVKEQGIIWATSRDHRDQFRIYPVNEDTLKMWQDLKDKNPTESVFDLLGQFGQNLDHTVIKEILCPFSHSSEEEFETIIRRTRPNAVQIFGCPTLTYPSMKIIEQVRKISGTIPIILPFSENNPLLPLSGISKFVSVDSNQNFSPFMDGESAKILSPEMKYSLTRGALLKVNTPITNVVYLTKDQETIEAAFDLEIEALWPYEITALEVTQSNGKSFRRDVSIQTGEYAITKFTTKVQSNMTWLQLNVIGKLISQYPGLSNQQNSEQTLASSAPIMVSKETPLNN